MRRTLWICLLGLAVVLMTFSFGCNKPATVPESATPSEQETVIKPPEQDNNSEQNSVVEPPEPQDNSSEQETVVKLPEPRYDSDVSLEQSLLERRSIRDYTGEPVTLPEVSQLLWAAQGITDPRGFRAAPSAGALYPLKVYLFASDVQDLAPGVYRYEPDGHQLSRIVDGDKRAELADAAFKQSHVREGAAAFVFTGVYERTTGKYGDRGIRYVHMEVGHAAQNLCLQATALGLGVVTVGAFNEKQVTELLNKPENEQPLYIIPAGRK